MRPFTYNIIKDRRVNSYVYACLHKTTDKLYIGARWANKLPPEEDFGIVYFTSSEAVKHKWDEFDSEILFEHKNIWIIQQFERDAINTYKRQGILLNRN